LKRPANKNADQHTPIAIVGMDCLFPGAQGLDEYWRLIRWSDDTITDVPDTHWSVREYYDADINAVDRTYCRRGAFLSPVAFNPMEFGIPPKALEATDTAQLLGLMVAKRALEDAGYGAGVDYEHSRTGVILGVTGTQELVIPLGARMGYPVWRKALDQAGVSADVAEEVVREISEAYVGWQEASFPGLLGNVVAGRIANRLNLKGTNCVVDAACASSLSALHLGMMELASGKSDMVLTGGVDTLNDIFMFMCFTKTQALSASGDARPFSKNADGTVIGEGVGMVVLKRLADAVRDQDRIYGVIRGVGTSSDGKSQSIYSPRADGQAECLRNAYRAAGVGPSTIELVEAHGTGTRVGDVAEAEALNTVYREARATGTWAGLGSVKSQIGHTKAAAGVAGVIKAALALHHKVLPATCKVDEPHPKMDLANSPFYINTETRPWIGHDRYPRRSCVSAFGFGGSNFHVVLEEHEANKKQVAWDGTVQLVAFSGVDRASIEKQLGEWVQVAEQGIDAAEFAWRAAESRKNFKSDDACRLLVVIEREDDWVKRFGEARELLAERAEEANWSLSNIFFGSGEAQGKVAFLFPGQGSQYPYMGRDLVCMFPEAHDSVTEADRIAAGDKAGRNGDDKSDDDQRRISSLVYPQPTFDQQVKRKQREMLKATENAQPTIGAVSLGMWKVLQYFGVQADLVAGHSYGELVALRAAGRIDDATLHRLSLLRGQLMASGKGDRGTMLAVHAPLNEIDELIQREKLDVIQANRNAPKQGVLSGSAEAIEKAEQACKKKEWRSTRLEVSAAFHSPFMQEAEKQFRKALNEAAFKKGTIRVLANVTADVYPKQVKDVRDTLARQLVSPVRWVEEVEWLYEQGVRQFVEVGPGRVLSGLTSKILADRPATVMGMDESGGRRSGVSDLAKVLSKLAAGGYSVALSKWEQPAEKPEKPKMTVSLLGTNYRAERKSGSGQSMNKQSAVKKTTKQNAARGTVAASNHKSNVEGDAMAAPSNGNQNAYAEQTIMNQQSNQQNQWNNQTQQQQAGNALNQPPANANGWAGVYQVVQEGLQAMQALQQQTAAAHQRFLETQEAAHRSFQMVMENQQRLVEHAMGMPVPPMQLTPPQQTPAGQDSGQHAPPAQQQSAMPMGQQPVQQQTYSQPPMPPTPSMQPPTQPAAGQTEGMQQAVVQPPPQVQQQSQPQPQAAAGQAAEATDGSGDGGEFEQVLLEVVSELTGYPAEMLELDMDMEADLGIDSIKRVEILAAVQSRMPQLKAVDSSYMGSLRTLRNIVDYMSDSPDDGAGSNGQKPSADEAQAAAAGEGSVSRPFELGRQVLQAVELPAVNVELLSIADGHEIWVTNDGTDLPAAVVKKLEAKGCSARVIEAEQVNGEAAGPVGGLIVLGRARQDTPTDWNETSRELKQAFVLAQKVQPALCKAAEAGGALLATVSRMDGCFGLTGGSHDAVQGGLAGLAKTAAHEWPGVRCKALDVDAQWADENAIAEAVVGGLAADGPIEVGLQADARCGLVLKDESSSDRQMPIEPGDVVIISGGARGVTAEAAVALAKACQPTLVLLGRSPAPGVEPDWLEGLQSEAEMKKAILANDFEGKPKPADLEKAYRKFAAAREICNTMQRIEQAGGRAEYRSLDVRDSDTVAGFCKEIRESYGPIRGLIHAAGVLEDRFIADKTFEQFEKVFDTKVAGLQSLLSAVEDDELKVLALYSSVTARLGRQGQVDYAMANEVLNKIAQQQAKRRLGCKVVSMNWGPWDGGMVTPSLKREFERLGIPLIPLEAGARCMVEQIAGESDAVELVIGGSFPSSGGQVFSPAQAEQTEMSSDGRSAGRRSKKKKGKKLHTVFERRLDVKRHGFLSSHVINGRPVLPVVMMMEWLGHGALCENPGLLLHGIDELRVLKGVILDDGDKQLRVLASPPVKKENGFTVNVELQAKSGKQEITHARAEVLLVDSLPALPGFERNPDVQGDYPYSIERIYSELLFHGPHFQAIEQVTGVSENGIAVQLKSGSPPVEWMNDPLRTEWIADPLVLDGGLQAGILWCYQQVGQPSLPSFGWRYRQYVASFPRGNVRCVLQVQKAGGMLVTADVAYLDGDGRLVACMEGFDWTVDSSLRSAFGRDAVIGT